MPCSCPCAMIAGPSTDAALRRRVTQHYVGSGRATPAEPPADADADAGDVNQGALQQLAPLMHPR